eukprot:jgi/Botrbrau1/16227/Bobra.0066s0013.1
MVRAMKTRLLVPRQIRSKTSSSCGLSEGSFFLHYWLERTKHYCHGASFPSWRFSVVGCAPKPASLGAPGSWVVL